MCLISDSVVQQTSLCHRRLSHLNFRYIDQLVQNKLVNGLPSFKFERESLCAGCEKGKMKKASHRPKPEQGSKRSLSLLHMDLCGPIRVATLGGKKYVLVIVDDSLGTLGSKF